MLDLSGGLPPTVLLAPLQLTSTAGNESWPHFQPSGGDVLLFASDDSAQWEIYTANLGNWEGTLTNLPSNPAADTQPHWSTISNRIVFLSDRSGSREIYMMNFDGSGVLLISNGVNSEQQPHWQR